MPRLAVTITGTVQGVGFRPYVFELARGLGLSGFVRNQAGGVQIEIEGDAATIDHFLDEVKLDPPPLAQIEQVVWTPLPTQADAGFRIVASKLDGDDEILVSPDLAVCEDCLAEMFDPADRRYRYPLLNCTQCGPRLTIIRIAPYDRERTTMARFAMCAACRREYDDPTDRRFHAQATACPDCGPRLELLDRNGRRLPAADPIRQAAAALGEGNLLAIKGLGGYHLACDAANEVAVAELRRRKGRDAKPLAVMVADLSAAAELCVVSAFEAELLNSRQAPIVLLVRRSGARIASQVAPRNSYMGVMLAYTPLHHALLRELGGLPLVMTSGNRADGPIVFRDDEAVERLRGVADLYLTHDRPIQLGCDDSLTRVVAGAELPIRRSRGHAPKPLALPRECGRPTLALGGQMKSTFALGRGRQAILSQHLGDLDEFGAYQAYVAVIEQFERLFAFRPELLVHDLHPDYASTRYAVERNSFRLRSENGMNSDLLPPQLLAVQHHHAHMAACMAEHGLNAPVIGVVFDGTGFGTDGAVWGGEFLVGDYAAVRRAAHLRYVPLVGGEQAIREPWRMAASHLLDAGDDLGLLADRVQAAALATVERMIIRKINSPPTSSIGRLFDAVAVLAGGTVIMEGNARTSYEAQAALELEWQASPIEAGETYPFELVASAGGLPWIVDTRPVISAIAKQVRNGYAVDVIGRQFHGTLVEIVAQVCGRLREQTGIEKVVLSGGAFLNALLLTGTFERLTRDGFCAYRHRLVPPNDGGLSLGQLAVAAAQCG